MDTPISHDEQNFKEEEMMAEEERNKAHDSGEIDPNWKTCEYAKPNYDMNGHFDEVWCHYTNNELNFCGVPCPRTKGE